MTPCVYAVTLPIIIAISDQWIVLFVSVLVSLLIRRYYEQYAAAITEHASEPVDSGAP
jgi:hypothetical protein